MPIKINAVETSIKYAKDVASGAKPAGKLQQLAANRFLDDLNRGHERGLRLDAKSAQIVVNFICRLPHIKGVWDTKTIALSPWQTFVVTNLFGWKKADGFRRFNEGYIEVARKNGKSTVLAGIGLYMLGWDKEPGAQVYSAAAKIDQAREIFDVAAAMVKQDSWLNSRIQITGKSKPTCLYILDSASQFKPLPYEGSGAGTGDGKNVSCALLDELHQHPDRGQYDMLSQGILSRKQGLLLAITTAGFDRYGVCYSVRERHEKILARAIPVQECDSVFSFICCADTEDEDHWDQEWVWAKANPNMGVSFAVDALRAKANNAKHEPSSLNEFKRKHLCFWTSAETRCIGPEDWAKCNAAGPHVSPIKLRTDALLALSSENVFAGLDLSQKVDLTALVLVCPPQEENGKWKLVPWFWMPLLRVDQRVQKDKLPYDRWVREGYIETTPGSIIDYAFIRRRVNELQKQFQIQEIAYDPFYATQTALELQQDGIKMRECRQGMATMTEPTKNFLARITAEPVQIEHYGNPVLSWMADNMVVTTDAAGGMKPDKEHAKEKIDGIVASIMGMWCAGQNPEGGPSVYNKRGILFI